MATTTVSSTTPSEAGASPTSNASGRSAPDDAHHHPTGTPLDVWQSRTLVLNASMEPLCVVSLHRAVLLMLAGKARVLESDGYLHSSQTAVPRPSVLVLARYVHVPVRRPVPPTRRTVLQRDAHLCAYCGGGADTVDHVQPRSRGGRHEWGNVVAACVRCNHRKADRLLHELGWTLPFTPRAPRWSLTTTLRPNPQWAPYVP